jgi:hypothetical protein
MIEIDPTFDEGNFGFSKFSRFLSEAGSRDLVQLRKLENGQYEVTPAGSAEDRPAPESKNGPRRGGARGSAPEKEQESRTSAGKGKQRAKKEARPEDTKGDRVSADEKPDGKKRPKKGGRKADKDPAGAKESGMAPDAPKGGDDPLKLAYGVLEEALEALTSGDGSEGSVRDSDLKRKMLQIEPGFDEGQLGFGKFSRFLRQAHDHEIVDLEKRDEGTYQVSPRGKRDQETAQEPDEVGESGPDSRTEARSGAGPEPETEGADGGAPLRKGVGVRRGGGRVRKGQDGPPPFLEGQVVAGPEGLGKGESAVALDRDAEESHRGGRQERAKKPRASRGRGKRKGQEELELGGAPSGDPVDFDALGLPTDEAALIRYLTNSYKGVGRKTAERVVAEFGSGLFRVLHREPHRLESVVKANRVGQLLEGWKADLARRSGRPANGEGSPGPEATEGEAPPRRRTRKGTRRSRGGGPRDERGPS